MNDLKVKKKKIFTQTMIDWLAKNAYKNDYSTLTQAFNKRFGKNVKESTIFYCLKWRKIKIGKIRRHKPDNHLPIGTERVKDKGAAGTYIYVKVACTGNRHKDWKIKQHHIWEQANGRKIPKCHVIVFADNNKSNFEPDNLLCMSAAEVGRLGKFGLIFENAELTKQGLAIVKLKIGIANAIKRKNKKRKSA